MRIKREQDRFDESPRRVTGERVELGQVKAARRSLNRKALNTKKPARRPGPRASAVRTILDGGKALEKLGAPISEEHASLTRMPLELLPSHSYRTERGALGADAPEALRPERGMNARGCA